MKYLPLEAFIKKIRELKSNNAREYRMTIQEAIDLSASLNELLLDYYKNQKKSIDVSNKKSGYDGGKF